MFHEALSKTNLTDLPVLGLIVFLSIFLVVSLRVLLRGKDDPAMTHLASLPLVEDAVPDATPAPDPLASSSSDDEGAPS